MTTKKKLLKLADFLENKVKNHWFDMDTWATEGFKEKNCGTTACAAGWATVCFPRSGLTLVGDGEEAGLEYRPKGVDKPFHAELACSEFFGLDDDTANYLFMPDNYLSGWGKNNVIKRLREVAALPKCTMEETDDD